MTGTAMPGTAGITGGFLSDPALAEVLATLEDGGHRALIVGGAVRNAALGLPVSDVDIATDAHPERVIELAGRAGLKSVPTGIGHGTVTLVARGTPFEVTTFRRDVETYGRAARVSFSDRIEDDAARRDFTMNAIYVTPSGQIIDPIGGWPDLCARKLRFVGDAAQRIREDYLRILRFFRFLACYARDIHPGTLDAVAAGRAGLEQIPAERIGAEMRKLLAAPDPAPAMALMAQTGVLAQILPDADVTALPALITAEAEYGIAPGWLRRLALIDGGNAATRLRLSRAESARLALVHDQVGTDPAATAFHHGVDIAKDSLLITAAQGRPPMPGWDARITRAAASPLPVTARDLMPALAGPALGHGLRAAQEAWIASDFSAPKSALVAAALHADEAG